MSGLNTLISRADATLTRIESGPEGTFGKLVVRGFSCFTGELSWSDNQPNLSCIPTGCYVCSWTYSEHFKRFLYEIEEVAGRTGIRIHSANFMGDDRKGFKKQLNGCVALGMKLSVMDGQKALLVSMPAVRQFEALMNKKDFVLEIR